MAHFQSLLPVTAPLPALSVPSVQPCVYPIPFLFPPHVCAPSSLLLHVTLKQQDDGRVRLGSLFELLQGDLIVVIFVHLGEDLIHALLRS